MPFLELCKKYVYGVFSIMFKNDMYKNAVPRPVSDYELYSGARVGAKIPDFAVFGSARGRQDPGLSRFRERARAPRSRT